MRYEALCLHQTEFANSINLDVTHKRQKLNLQQLSLLLPNYSSEILTLFALLFNKNLNFSLIFSIFLNHHASSFQILYAISSRHVGMARAIYAARWCSTWRTNAGIRFIFDPLGARTGFPRSQA
ncbi:MAG: hypothetical protein ACYS6K_26195 [Planctomycetota bacterium]